jgi:predicted amidophosphoribosyltransferase
MEKTVAKTHDVGEPSALALSEDAKKIKVKVTVEPKGKVEKTALCKNCKKSICKCGKACGKSVVKTDKNSPRGREVLPEGELKDKMKDAGEYTGPAKPIVKK